MHKRIMSLFLMFAILFPLFPTALAKPISCEIRDSANLFSYDDLEKMADILDTFPEDVSISIVTLNENNESAEDYAKEYLEEKNTARNIIFLIDMDNRMIWIEKTNDIKNVSAGQCNSITDNIYEYASDGEYGECVCVGLSQLCDLLNNKPIPEPMKHISNVFLALVAAMFINLIRLMLSTKKKKATNEEIADNIKTSYTIENDTMTHIGTKVIHHNSSSSGGSSGGGSSGGSSGGGHGF